MGSLLSSNLIRPFWPYPEKSERMKLKSDPARRRLFGPVTLALTAGIAGFTLYNFAFGPRDPQLVSYRADPSGQLHRVGSSSGEPAPTLWKPTPQVVLLRANELRLTSEQRIRVERIQKDWIRTRNTLNKEVERITQLIQGGDLRVNAAAPELDAYSDLSRSFDRERRAAWLATLEVLSPEQRVIAEQPGEIAHPK